MRRIDEKALLAVIWIAAAAVVFTLIRDGIRTLLEWMSG